MRFYRVEVGILSMFVHCICNRWLLAFSVMKCPLTPLPTVAALRHLVFASCQLGHQHTRANVRCLARENSVCSFQVPLQL